MATTTTATAAAVRMSDVKGRLWAIAAALVDYLIRLLLGARRRILGLSLSSNLSLLLPPSPPFLPLVLRGGGGVEVETELIVRGGTGPLAPKL